jgi:hypothetical protein
MIRIPRRIPGAASLAASCSSFLFLTVAANGGDAPSTFRGAPSEVIELRREGFGAASKGGEGGKVIWVTNLHSKGPGSFREAYQAEGARTIRFKVGGTIMCSRPSLGAMR